MSRSKVHKSKCIYFEVCPTIGCSVCCDHCPQSLTVLNYKKLSKIQYLDINTFKKCVNKLPVNTHLVFSGFAEPFLNPQILEMLEYSYNKEFKINVFTTLTGFKLEYINFLKNIPFEKFRIHLPSNNNDMNIELNEAYFRNLNSIIENRTQNMDFVVLGNKKHHLLSIIHDKDIIFKEPYSRAGSLKGYETITHKGKIRCSLNNHFNNVLLPNGDVVLCCNDFKLEHIIGNLLKNDYQSLHTSDEFKKVINGLGKNTVPILCRKCELAVPENISFEQMNCYSKHLAFYDFKKILE